MNTPLFYGIKFKLGGILLLFSLILIGCGRTVDEAVSTEASSLKLLKVAMILPGPIDDESWNTTGYEGLQLIEQDLGAQVDYQATVPVSEAEAVLREYATEEYDFIIAHGGQYLSAIETVAEAFPRLKFAIVTQYAGNNRNLGALSFRDDEMGYLCGVVAGLKTKTNHVAYMGGEALPHMVNNTISFAAGAKSVNPEVEVSVEWVGNWTDQDKAREIAQTLLAEQVDVFAVNADTAGLSVHQVAKGAGVYSVGWVTDQHGAAPDTVLTSCIQRTPLILLEATKLVQRRRWEGKQYKFGLQDEVQDLAPFRGALTAEEEAVINRVKSDIINGIIVIPH